MEVRGGAQGICVIIVMVFYPKLGKKCNFTLSIILFFVHLVSRIFEHFAIIPLHTLQDFDIHFEKYERERKSCIVPLVEEKKM